MQGHGEKLVTCTICSSNNSINNNNSIAYQTQSSCEQDTHFYSYDVDFDPLTLIYELDLTYLEAMPAYQK